MQENLPTHILFTPRWKSPGCSPQRTDITVGLSGCRKVHMLWLHTRMHSLSQKQEKILPHEVITPAQAVWDFYLSIRKCSNPKPYSYASVWVWWQCTQHCLPQHLVATEFANIFSCSMRCLFMFLKVSFEALEFSNFNVVQFVYCFFFLCLYFWCHM